MAKKNMSGMALNVEDETNLDAVTTATNGDAVDTRWYKDKTVFVNVSVNTGAVTVNIESSHDGTTWFDLTTKTYTATTGKDTFSYTSFYPYMRTTTTTQSNSTVTTTITGRS
jgi:hypothetical protein